jgi:ADP-dependent NAD(P)H-hydrate dehydratase / NAD(P)H-hydrate epimerase
MIGAMTSELPSCAEMGAIDRAAVEAGVPSLRLMENAGAAVARHLGGRFKRGPVAVLCGPGNNGGDGFVVARHLHAAGWPVRVGLLGERASLRGDAAAMAAICPVEIEPIAPDLIEYAGLIVDALFGAGLSRPLEGAALTLVRVLDHRDTPVVAIDMPSGVSGDTGQVAGGSARADLTVTFHRRKPGHLLLPGRELCGELVVADIGIPDSVHETVKVETFANVPELWRDVLPIPKVSGHKYDRGHALIVGGGELTGAARLASETCLRAGAGLVTLAAPEMAVDLLRVAAPAAVMVRDLRQFDELLADKRHNAVLLGPGNGADEPCRARIDAVRKAGRVCVLDADALRALSPLAVRLTRDFVLTPHDGEFVRLFPDLTSGDRLNRARIAAARSGAVIVLKGADTVVAHPDGPAAIADNAPPWLATAGSGDVLAGAILALLAQGMDAFFAASAAVWFHGQAAKSHGPGLIADDLPICISQAMAPFLTASKTARK